MANLFDYLEWRADVPLSADPFNEVDNLLLSELSYADFNGVVAKDEKKTTVSEVQKRFFEINDREEVLKRTGFTAKAPILLDEMATGNRFKDAIMSDFIDVIDVESEEQMSAVTFRLPDKTIYVAFRGTDGTVVGWKEDISLSYLNETAGQKRAADYLTAIGEKYKGKIRVGGHSKGGNFAVFAATFCDSKVQRRIIEVWSNDGPGFRDEVIDTPEYKRILPKIKSIVPETSIIGMLLSTDTTHQVVKSDSSGILQHDGFSWQIKRNRFEEAELDEQSTYIEDTISSWLEQMDDETRRSITTTVFSVLESTGNETFKEMGNQMMNSMGSILNAMGNLPREKKIELTKQIGELVSQSGKIAISRTPFLSEIMNPQIEKNEK